MKKSYIIIFYSALLTAGHTSFLKEQALRGDRWQPNTMTPAFYERPIQLLDLQQNATSMLTITNEGRYYLSNDTAVRPTRENAAMITIATNNVTLNLNSRSITHPIGASGLTAMQIAANCHQVTIENGTIIGINGTGINISNGCSSITLRNLMIIGCSLVGILATNCDNLILQDITIIDCTGAHPNATNGAVAAQLTSCTNLFIKNASFNRNQVTSRSSDAIGLLLQNCSDCRLEHCLASSNQGNRSYGFMLDTNCNGCSFSDCYATLNTGTANAYGFYINSATNCFFESCHAESTSSAANAYGFYLNQTYGQVLIKCRGHNAQGTAPAANAYGFYAADGSSCRLHECYATCNTAGTATTALGAGIYIESNEQDATITNCLCRSNNGGGGTGYGIFINGTRCYVENNKIILNTGTTNGFGIYDTAPLSKSCWIKNMAFGNGNTAKTVVNNFAVTPAPTGAMAKFPSVIAYLNDYSPLGRTTGFDNIEIIEKG